MLSTTKRSLRRIRPRPKRSIFDEIAEFLATSPSRDALLDYHPPSSDVPVSSWKRTVKEHSRIRTVVSWRNLLTPRACFGDSRPKCAG